MRMTNARVKDIKYTYLFSGMCSKGPVVGIGPHKLLLDTSLEIHTCMVNLITELVEKN